MTTSASTCLYINVLFIQLIEFLIFETSKTERYNQFHTSCRISRTFIFTREQPRKRHAEALTFSSAFINQPYLVMRNNWRLNFPLSVTWSAVAYLIPYPVCSALRTEHVRCFRIGISLKMAEHPVKFTIKIKSLLSSNRECVHTFRKTI